MVRMKLWEFIYWWQVLVYGSAILYYLTKIAYDGNIFLSRASDIDSGHTLSWTAVILFALYVRSKMPKEERPIYNAMQSALIVLFTMGVVEAVFRIIYYSIDFRYYAATIFTDMEIASVFILSLIFRTYRFFRYARGTLSIAILLFFMMMWRIAGMHTTIGMGVGTPSQYYHDTSANLFEVMHWVLGISLAAWAFKINHSSSSSSSSNGL